MLVLPRRLGQIIRIGDGIQVKVIRIGKGKVRLGVIADKSIPVKAIDPKKS